MWDLAIVGAGPAGLSAAVNAARRNKQTVVFGPSVSEKLHKTECIENYLGLAPMTGAELAARFREQAQRAGAQFRPERVQTVYGMGDRYGLLLPSQEIVEARAVLLATGVSMGREVPGESTFLGRGASTCATCDAPLYRGKRVVVVGETEEAVEEANFIAELAAQTIFVNRLGRAVRLRPGIQERTDRPLELLGDTRARALRFAKDTLEADGFFFLRDAQAPDRLAPGLHLDGGHIAVDANQATNLPGVFAAGDCTGGPYQVNIAAGDGQRAALAAVRWLAQAPVPSET